MIKVFGVLFLIALVLAVLYVGVGFIVTYANAASKDDEYEVNWDEILSWPKDVFGK